MPEASAVTEANAAPENKPASTVADALPKTYDPAGTESRWQQAWEQAGAFHPDPQAAGELSRRLARPPSRKGGAPDP